jgi:hypothetical protein
LLGSGDIAISTGLTVGTTAIASGTVGRVLFQGTGNVVQQDAALFWDNTNKRLGIGATPDVNTVLDVRSAGTLATDLAFRVRNSANTANLYQAQGDGQHWFNPYQTSDSVNDVIIGGSNLANSKGGLRIATGNGALTLIGRSNTQNPSIISGNGKFAFETVANGTFAYAQFNVSVAQASNSYITILASNTNQNSGIRLSAGGSQGLFLGVVGTDFLNINTTSGSVNIGYGSTLNSNAKLDVKAAGALSTDIAFRVRNSADSANIFQINGDSSGGWNIDSKVIKFGSGSRITTGANYLDGLVIGFSLYSCALSTAFQAQGNSINNLKQICIGGAYDDSEASAIFYNIVGTPAVVANTFKMYSNDIVAGNACPHFKTEAGNIIKLYKETTAVAAAAFVANTSLIANDSATFGGYTMGQVVAALKAQGLLA